MSIIPSDIERQLVRGLSRGDSTATRMIYDYLVNYLNGVCSRYIDDDDDARDVLQETLIKIFSKIDQFEYKGNGSLQAWSTRIAINESLSYLRQKKKSNTVPLETDFINESPDPDVSEIPQEVVLKMIRELPQQYRTVFNLYVFEDKSHKEIAELLGIKENSSASNLHRAKKLLCDMIVKYQKNQE